MTTLLKKAPIYLSALSFLPNVLAQCVNCENLNNAVLPTAAIAGIVIGVVLLLSIVGIIFAVVRQQRIRQFQRNYIQNAQANAAGMNVLPPAYPSAVHPSHHTHHMHHHHAHNLAAQQANMQNNQFASSGFGPTSGSTGIM
ncbi:hypothetical protein K438DRAFT_1927913 [Mycena galopus ATCC 62051]|nr:hypothetical protein K438DRAFT_1927913 [Mycena galopus ATCC 62051]